MTKYQKQKIGDGKTNKWDKVNEQPLGFCPAGRNWGHFFLTQFVIHAWISQSTHSFSSEIRNPHSLSFPNH
jgi:hypothetical protein